jgi:SAM-dependent methyltransferase
MADHTAALSFGSAAADYDRHRPSYPVAALRWALGETPRRVVELGAGTGILTRALRSLGHDVVPVEPDAAMRAQLEASTPGVTALPGTAEAIPLPDGSVDAVVAGQAYRWFDRAQAHPEIARVLRPGGIFAPVWNRRDESVPWVAALSAVADDARGGRGVRDDVPELVSFGPRFAPLERAQFGHTVRTTFEGVVELIKTRSYYLTADAARRAEVEAAVRDLAVRFPELAGGEFELPYRTIVYRAARR